MINSILLWQDPTAGVHLRNPTHSSSELKQEDVQLLYGLYADYWKSHINFRKSKYMNLNLVHALLRHQSLQETSEVRVDLPVNWCNTSFHKYQYVTNQNITSVSSLRTFYTIQQCMGELGWVPNQNLAALLGLEGGIFPSTMCCYSDSKRQVT